VRSHIADDMPKVALAFRIALLVKSGQSFHECNAGLDHGRKLACKQNQVSLLNRPNALAGAGGRGFSLEGEHHEPAAHEARYGIVFIQGILNARNDSARGVSSLVGEGDHIIAVLMHIAATVP
jgi:hypothetical protein